MTRTPQKIWFDHLSHAENYNRWILDILSPYLGKKILEIGCGVGTFTSLLADRGHLVTAVDIEPAYIEEAEQRLSGRDNIRFICRDARNGGFVPEFDTIVMLDVLEHVYDDAAILDTLRSALKHEGVLALKVPAVPRLKNAMDHTLGHYRRYSGKGLAGTLEMAGFEPLHIRYFNFPGLLGWWVNGTLLGRRVASRGNVRFFDRLGPLFKAAESLIPPPIGLSLWAVARPMRP